MATNNNRVYSILFAVAVVAVGAVILLDPVWDDISSASKQSFHKEPVSLAQSVVAPVALNEAALFRREIGTEFLRWAQRGAALGELPASVRGTQVDGSVGVDAQGNLVLNIGLRRLFDYFLATIGEEDLDQIRARIAFYLQQNLPEAAALDAWAVLAQYLAYKDALDTLPGHDGSYTGMRDSLQRQRDARDALLGPELVTAFFQEEDQYADFALEHIDNLRNQDLSVQEKQQITDTLLARLPEATRDLIQATGAPLQAAQQVDILREQGSSDAEIWHYREQQFGSEAAERLTQLDQQRAAWNKRYSEYSQQRQQIERSELDAADKQAEIIRLQQQQFSEAEQKRVQALDRIAAEQQVSARTAE